MGGDISLCDTVFTSGARNCCFPGPARSSGSVPGKRLFPWSGHPERFKRPSPFGEPAWTLGTVSGCWWGCGWAPPAAVAFLRGGRTAPSSIRVFSRPCLSNHWDPPSVLLAGLSAYSLLSLETRLGTRFLEKARQQISPALQIRGSSSQQLLLSTHHSMKAATATCLSCDCPPKSVNIKPRGGLVLPAPVLDRKPHEDGGHALFAHHGLPRALPVLGTILPLIGALIGDFCSQNPV